jgi:hypothetical protein
VLAALAFPLNLTFSLMEKALVSDASPGEENCDVVSVG